MEDLFASPDQSGIIRYASLTHVVEPKYPGAVESLVDITSCWDADKLHACGKEIIRLSDGCSRCHEQCCRFLSAAASLTGDTYRLALDALNTDKLAGYCTRLSDKEFKPTGKQPGKERVRFLSAVTNKGTVSFLDSAKRLCKRIYLINDDYGAVSRMLLLGARRRALAAGHEIISCYCPLGPYDKLEHLFVPSLGVGFLTSNRFHNFTDALDPWRIVNSQRFSDHERLREYKKRILFNRKAAAKMLTQAEVLLQDAKGMHDELESYYIHATDFGKVDALTARVLQRVRSFT